MQQQVIEKLTSLVGTQFYKIEGIPVEKGKIREFSMAIQEDNAIFFEEQAARDAGFPSIPVPLTFSQSINFWNTYGSPILNFGMDLRYVLHGGQEYEYYKPIFAGDTLNAVCRLADVYEKKGSRGGVMLFVVLETEFTNQQGEKVLSSKQILIQTGGVIKREE